MNEELTIGITPSYIAIFATVILCACFHFFNQFKGKIIRGNPDGKLHFVIQKLSGLIILGAIPYYYLVQKDGAIPFYLVLDNEGFEVVNRYVLIAGFVSIGISSVYSAKEDNLKTYPQIKDKSWTLATAVISSLGWIAHLIGAEFLFRGFLLMSCLAELDPIGAIMINSILYGLTQASKGRNEAIGAFVVGLILCMITIKPGPVWVAIVVHIIMALANEYFSFKANPETKFSFR